MKYRPDNSAITGGLLMAIFLWGASNAGTKVMVQSWPPIFVGSSRFLLAGLAFFALLRWSNLFGAKNSISKDANRRLWWRTGLTLAAYISVFNWSVKLTAVSHVVLYLGAAPIWALLWEGRPERNWRSVQRFGAAALALLGVFVLLWPTLGSGTTNLLGEILGLSCGVLWTYFGRQCRALSTELSAAEISAHSFWRAGILTAPLAALDYAFHGAPLRANLLWIHAFCILGGGVAAFVLWNTGLRYWKTSQVYLFNNLIPVSTMLWAHFCLGEPMTATFWTAMLLIATGVIIGQANWQKLFDNRALSLE